MGVDTTAYLGPYLEYTVTRTRRTVSTCPDPDACPEPVEGFCSRCGKKAAQRLQTVTVEDPDVYVMGDYDEAIVSVGAFGASEEDVDSRTYQCLPNKHRPGRPERETSWDAGRHEEAVVPVSPEQVRAETEWFEVAFAEEIADLRLRCGHENVAVRWGLVLYSW